MVKCKLVIYWGRVFCRLASDNYRSYYIFRVISYKHGYAAICSQYNPSRTEVKIH